ncbi:Retrovirus-related Pol polyprotein from transposon TNT 1-94 [Senna tora]|uniref:Retrovirus-related Pol polyprotein from transposon TNT 1-94 n=1 Tax=Senna tora TaxID=362788 RepID=A0A834TRD6_9FABA|nr:Retrovirus-related Pol polyprotein from transposon TNT 1-94 [Senna tora]
MSSRNTVVFGTMTSTVDSSSSTPEHAPTVATSSFQYSDTTTVLITGNKLNGQNYLQWRQSVFMFVCGKGKDDYLSGVAKAPSQQDASYKSYNWSCSTDAQYFKKLVEENRLYKFLLGLNETFEDVHGRILGRSSLPSLKETFSEVRPEESRKKINNTNTSHTPLEHSALTTRGSPRSRSSATHHVETTDFQPFSQNQIEFLQKLLGQSSTSSGMPSTGHIAQSVKIADGTMVKVSGNGSVKISANLTLLNDLASGKMIGSAEECNGLYLLGPTIFLAFPKTALNVTCLPDILLWHYRLGHPNFHYMQKLYPNLFRNKSSILL